MNVAKQYADVTVVTVNLGSSTMNRMGSIGAAEGRQKKLTKLV